MTAPNRAAEEHVLGAMLLEPERWQQVADLTLTNFAYPEHRAVFQTMAELASTGLQPTLDAVLERLTATDRLKVAGGEAAVRRLHADTATASTISHYADILRATKHGPDAPKPKRHTRSRPLAATPGATLKPDGTVEDTGSSYVAWQSLGLDCAGNGQPFPSLGNAAIILARHPYLAGRLWLDTFRQKIYCTLDGEPRPLSNADALQITAWVNQSLRLPKIGIRTIENAIELVAANAKRNSVTEYLDGLTWDGTPRLEDWLADCLGVAKTAYTVAVARNWLLSMVARAYRPGCKADHMPVLEGLSGAGKSSALAVLGGPWYKAAPQAFGSKEFLEAIQGAWLTEIPDMVGFGRREHTQIIAAVTTTSDTYRAAYARVSEDHPRTTIFAATSETDSYLDDDRGKRRYWPLRCTEIRLDVLRACRDQLFAEATAQFKAGATWHEVPAEEAEHEQLERRIGDPWEDAIAHYVKGRLEVEISDLITQGLAIEYSRQDRATQMRAAKVLKTFGFECKVVWDGTRAVRRYFRKP